MRLGLIGLGKQGQRYLQERNGGRHIVKQLHGRPDPVEYQEWLDGLDGVIIATHPQQHRWLALDAIADGKHVLCEKPLCLNLEDCEEVIDAAEEAGVAFDVAHTHLWSEGWKPPGWRNFIGSGHVEYSEHSRDYSPWLDWAPHALALIASRVDYATRELRHAVSVEPGPLRRIHVAVGSGLSRYHYHGDCAGTRTPMWNMVYDFMSEQPRSYTLNRRIYRALFAEE